MSSHKWSAWAKQNSPNIIKQSHGSSKASEVCNKLELSHAEILARSGQAVFETAPKLPPDQNHRDFEIIIQNGRSDQPRLGKSTCWHHTASSERISRSIFLRMVSNQILLKPPSQNGTKKNTYNEESEIPRGRIGQIATSEVLRIFCTGQYAEQPPFPRNQ